MKSIYSKLLILMTLSWSVGFSQDTTIELEYQLARYVIEDLVIGDSAKEELFLTKEQIETLNQKIVIKDSIILKKDAIISNYEQIIGTRDEQLGLSKELTGKLKTDLKKQKAKAKMFGIGSGVLAAAALLLVL